MIVKIKNATKGTQASFRLLRWEDVCINGSYNDGKLLNIIKANKKLKILWFDFHDNAEGPELILDNEKILQAIMDHENSIRVLRNFGCTSFEIELPPLFKKHGIVKTTT